MITLSDRDRSALARAFPWFDALSPQPSAIASLNHMVAGALHFVTGNPAGLNFPEDAVVLVRPDYDPPSARSVETPEPRRTFAAMTRVLRDARAVEDVQAMSNGALVSASARIGPACRIEPGAIVGPGAEIAEACTIAFGAVVHPGARIGPRSRVLARAIVGADGFGHAFPDGAFAEPIAHLGGIEIGADVDIGPGAIVSAGTIDPTTVRDGAKIDGNVYIGHNAQIGEGSMICAHAVVGGSARIGRNVWINPAAVIKTKTSVGDDAVVGMGAVVMKPVPPGATVMGDTASEIRQRLRRDAAVDRLLAARSAADD